MRASPRFDWRAWLALLALLAPLLLPGPLAAQPMPNRSPGADSPAAQDQVQIYREAERLVGRVSIPDPRLAVLVQPEGRDWRAFQAVWLRWVAAVAILGIVVLLAVFYLWRGRIRIEHGWAGRTIARFGPIERFGHWLTAVSFLVLALTGLIVTFGRPLLIPLIGHGPFSALAEGSKLAHNFFSFPFVLGLLLILVMWIRDNLPERSDWVWIRQGGGFLKSSGKGHAAHPEAGRFNAGQKLIFWAVVLGGAGLAVTGYLLMFPFWVTGVDGMQTVHIVHGLLAAVMIAVIIGHIYIGTLGMEGAFDAMASGEVDENWAREHHSRWYDQARRGRPPPSSVPAE
ncbi:MAG TPA: formate dehydrogenase subunit gamma [Geminicoccaceae bacterium]|nr:formate dehydrogenase subunit gamma [Geminicoccaceae bacterium]